MSLIYADDMCITDQYPSLSQVESTIKNSLCAKHGKKITSFHLRNRQAKISLKVSWNEVDLGNTTHSYAKSHKETT